MGEGFNYRGSAGTFLDYGKGNLTINGKQYGKPYALDFVENIFDPFRKGTITLLDPGPIMEGVNFYSSTEDDDIQLEVSNGMSKEEPLKFKIGLYNYKTTPAKAQGVMQKSSKIYSYELIDEPIFTKLVSRPIKKAYINKTPSEILEEMLTKTLKLKNVEKKIQHDEGDKISNFISPYWNGLQIIKYLSERQFKGPLLVFPFMENKKSKHIITTLSSLCSGVMGKNTETVLVKVSHVQGGNIIRPDYTVRGPNINSKLNELSGESIINYDYFSGESREDYKKDLIPTSERNKSAYSIEKGVKEYSDKKEHFYKSVISGEYKEGVKLFSKELLGDYSLFLKDKISFSDHKVSIDMDPRSMSENKLKSRFLKAAYDQMTIEAGLIPHSGIQIGKIYTIKLPSSMETSGNIPIYNESLQGEWLLVQLTHSFKVIRGQDFQYIMVGTFVRAGLSKSNHPSLKNEFI